MGGSEERDIPRPGLEQSDAKLIRVALVDLEIDWSVQYFEQAGSLDAAAAVG